MPVLQMTWYLYARDRYHEGLAFFFFCLLYARANPDCVTKKLQVSFHRRQNHVCAPHIMISAFILPLHSGFLLERVLQQKEPGTIVTISVAECSFLFSLIHA